MDVGAFIASTLRLTLRLTWINTGVSGESTFHSSTKMGHEMLAGVAIWLRVRVLLQIRTARMEDALMGVSCAAADHSPARATSSLAAIAMGLVFARFARSAQSRLLGYRLLFYRASIQ